MEIAVENALPFLPSAGWSPGLSDKVELQDFNRTAKETPMTDDRLPLAELAAKSGDSDFLRADDTACSAARVQHECSADAPPAQKTAWPGRLRQG